MIPVFQRLASNELLDRCLEGRTQNDNEALHSLIWSKCPKEVFVTKRRVTIAVCEAISEYNFGNSLTICDRHKQLGLSPGSKTLKMATQKDLRVVKRRQNRSTESFQRYRRTVRIAQMRAEEAKKKQKGPSYGPGAF